MVTFLKSELFTTREFEHIPSKEKAQTVEKKHSYNYSDILGSKSKVQEAFIKLSLDK